MRLKIRSMSEGAIDYEKLFDDFSVVIKKALHVDESYSSAQEIITKDIGDYDREDAVLLQSVGWSVEAGYVIKVKDYSEENL